MNCYVSVQFPYKKLPFAFFGARYEKGGFGRGILPGDLDLGCTEAPCDCNRGEGHAERAQGPKDEKEELVVLKLGSWEVPKYLL